MSKSPLTLDHYRGALEAFDFQHYDITINDAQLMGISGPSGEARIYTWLKSKGWTVIGEAAGNIHWSHAASGDHVWLSGLAGYAATDLVACLSGRAQLSQHDRFTQRDERPELELLAEIATTPVTDAEREQAEKLTGGGLLIVSPEGITTTSWGS